MTSAITTEDPVTELIYAALEPLRHRLHQRANGYPRHSEQYHALVLAAAHITADTERLRTTLGEAHDALILYGAAPE